MRKLQVIIGYCWVVLSLSGCGRAEGSLAEIPACHVGGCTGQICSSALRVITSCEWRPHLGCYSHSDCGPHGRDGTCAWKQTPEFLACMARASRGANGAGTGDPVLFTVEDRRGPSRTVEDR